MTPTEHKEKINGLLDQLNEALIAASLDNLEISIHRTKEIIIPDKGIAKQGFEAGYYMYI